jgi:hypothetical protein
MREEDERYLLRLLTQTELIHTVITILITIGVAAACFLLNRNHSQLQALQAQMAQRNEQGARSLVLLDEAIRKLEAR